MVIDNLVEMHCHILPGIDDGAKDVDTSLQMIRRLQDQGAKRIVLTPHYYSDTISLDDFLRNRDIAFNKLMQALPAGSPTLIPAAEVYISDILFNNKNLDELKIGNSNYILIEHPFSASFDQSCYDRLMNLYCDYGARPILAHIERYKALMDDTDLLDEYIDMGCLTQVNVSSFDDVPRGIRKKLYKLMNSGRIHFLGSDCHNLGTRPPEYEPGIKAITKKCGADAVAVMMANANNLTK